MPPVLADTFGGLSASYYARQLFFGLVILALLYFAITESGASTPAGLWLWLAINTLLYPYARFAYEGVVGFVVGDNIFYGNAFLMLTITVFTMMMCWSMAVFIAPLCLAYLYFNHRRARRQSS